jgi:site-specific recombinase XerD
MNLKVFLSLDKYYSPKIIGEVNDQYIKVVKIMWQDLGKLSRMAGLDKRITFHTARHSWAIRAFQKGTGIEYVSKLLGHASVKQTEVYARVMNLELDKAMEIFNTYRVPVS